METGELIPFAQKGDMTKDLRNPAKSNTKILYSVKQRNPNMLVKFQIKKNLGLVSELTNTNTCELVFRRKG